MTNTNRQPAGLPTGGQFAEGARAGADVSLKDGSKRYPPLLNTVHPDNLRVQAINDLAREMSAGDDDWQEHFPETIRSRWLHDIDPSDHADTIGPAMRAIEDGRSDDAMWHFNRLDAIHELEHQRNSSGYQPPKPTRSTTLPSGAKEVTGSRYNPDATPEQVASQIEAELEKARDAGHLVYGEIEVEHGQDGIIKVKYHPDDRHLLYNSATDEDGNPEGAEYSQYGAQFYYRVHDITDAYVVTTYGEHRITTKPHIEVELEEEDFDAGMMEDLNGLKYRDITREQG